MFTVHIPKIETSSLVGDMLKDIIKEDFFNTFKRCDELKNLDEKIIITFSEIASKILYHNIKEDRINRGDINERCN